MPNLNEMFPSKYLRSSDIDQDYEVSITKVEMDTVGQGDQKEEKYIVYFAEFDKGLVLNKTNAALIAAQHGDNTDLWKGKLVVLTVEDVTYQGKIVPAIRVKRAARPPAKPAVRTASAKPGTKPAMAGRSPDSEQAAADEAEDTVPF